MAGLVPAISIRDALCPPYRGRRDKPGDDTLLPGDDTVPYGWVVPSGMVVSLKIAWSSIAS